MPALKNVRLLKQGEAAGPMIMSGHPVLTKASEQSSACSQDVPSGSGTVLCRAACTSGASPNARRQPGRGRAEGMLVLGCALAMLGAGHAALPAGIGDARADRQEPTASCFPWRALVPTAGASFPQGSVLLPRGCCLATWQP